jgi:putative thioredoxin
MFQGQLVADLTPARTESALKGMLDKILAQLPIESAEAAQEAEIEPLIAMGEQVLAEGDAARALSIFDQIDEIAPNHPEIVSGRVRALVTLGELDTADAALAALPAEVKGAEIDRARAALDLARSAPPVADLSPLIAAAEADPENLQARFDLANAQMAAGERDAAADGLLAIVAKDRDWNEGAARTQFLKLLDVVGLEDPWVSGQRRRLSAILFTRRLRASRSSP